MEAYDENVERYWSLQPKLFPVLERLEFRQQYWSEKPPIVATLEMWLRPEDDEAADLRRLHLAFEGLDTLTCNPLGVIRFSLLLILSIKDRHWEYLKYEVLEKEEKQLAFYCRNFQAELVTLPTIGPMKHDLSRPTEGASGVAKGIDGTHRVRHEKRDMREAYQEEVGRHWAFYPKLFPILDRLELRQQKTEEHPFTVLTLEMWLRPEEEEIADLQRLHFSFEHVVDLKLKPWSVAGFSFLSILFIEDRQEEMLNYSISDEELNQLSFYCRDFQVELVTIPPLQV